MRKLYFIIYCLLFLSSGITNAQYTVLHYFSGPNGNFPDQGPVTLVGKELYGMTDQGGINGYGCIFSVDTNVNGYKDILDFNTTNGANPVGSLLYLNNKLYGAASGGGANNSGCIFSIDTDGSGYKDMFDFDTTNGSGPNGDFTLLGGSLYGMT